MEQLQALIILVSNRNNLISSKQTNNEVKFTLSEGTNITYTFKDKEYLRDGEIIEFDIEKEAEYITHL